MDHGQRAPGHGVRVSSSAEKEVIHFRRGPCQGPTPQGHRVCLFWSHETTSKRTMHRAVQRSYSSCSAFRARNESHSQFGQSNSLRGMEINASNVGINAAKERKEGSEERFCPELKGPEREDALWLSASASAPHPALSEPPSCLTSRLLPTQTKDPEGHGLPKNHCALVLSGPQP